MKESLYIFWENVVTSICLSQKSAKKIERTIILKTENFREIWVSLKAIFGKYRILILSPPL